MIGTALTFDDLRRLSRLGEKAKLATVERWANKNGIRYKYDGKGGIWTTAAALDAALGLSASPSDAEPYRADAIF